MAYTDNFASEVLPLITDLTSAELMQFSNTIFENAYPTTDIRDSITTLTGMRNGTVLPILIDKPTPDSFPFVADNNCNIESCDIDEEWSTHVWQIGLIECRAEICMRAFNENFLVFFNQYRNTQAGGADINLDSALIQFMTNKFTKNLRLSTWRAAFFGDTNSTSAFFNGVDGIFAQMSAVPENIVSITENQGATAQDQKFSSGEDVYNYLIEMYERAAEQPWFDPSILEYHVTKSMSSKLVSWLNAQGNNRPLNCNCIDPNAAVASNVFMMDGLTINGIPVYTHNEWDDIINYSAELNGGGGNNARVLPHRAILTFNQNLLIGTTQTEALNSFDIWYSKDDKKVYLEGSSYVGGGVPLLNEYVLAI